MFLTEQSQNLQEPIKGFEKVPDSRSRINY
jgi:hypothetical protein